MLNCVGVAGRGRERVMCFVEGQGVDGHMGDDFLCCFMFIFFHEGLK